jgi:hypothetical protein
MLRTPPLQFCEATVGSRDPEAGKLLQRVGRTVLSCRPLPHSPPCDHGPSRCAAVRLPHLPRVGHVRPRGGGAVRCPQKRGGLGRRLLRRPWLWRQHQGRPLVCACVCVCVCFVRNRGSLPPSTPLCVCVCKQAAIIRRGLEEMRRFIREIDPTAQVRLHTCTSLILLQHAYKPPFPPFLP